MTSWQFFISTHIFIILVIQSISEADSFKITAWCISERLKKEGITNTILIVDNYYLEILKGISQSLVEKNDE
jgi:hypothetical protein